MAPVCHTLGKSLSERENFLRRSAATMLAALHGEPVFERRNDHRSHASPGKPGELRSERIGPRILEVQALQNSTLYR